MNEGFSGGEKKRNEIFQMAVLEPKLAILDETDSGLDIDALRIVADGVNKLRSKENATIVVTHYQRLLNYIVPDFVHVLVDGRIVKVGGKELAFKLEELGYDWVRDEVEAAGEVNNDMTVQPNTEWYSQLLPVRKESERRVKIGFARIAACCDSRFRRLDFQQQRTKSGASQMLLRLQDSVRACASV